jgi:hypothetical protein
MPSLLPANAFFERRPVAVVNAATLAGAVAASLLVGVLIGAVQPGAPLRTQSEFANCRDAGLPGRILLRGGGDPVTAAAGSGVVSHDGRVLTISLAPGYTAGGLVAIASPYAYLYAGRHGGPIVSRRYELPSSAEETGRITDWFLCG